MTKPPELVNYFVDNNVNMFRVSTSRSKKTHLPGRKKHYECQCHAPSGRTHDVWNDHRFDARCAVPVRAVTGQKIAILPKTLINDVFQIKVAESAEQKAKKLGVATERFVSSSDVAVQDQINITEAVISRGEFGGIVLAATAARGRGNVVRKAKRAGLFVVPVGSKTDAEDFVTVIQTDNIKATGVGADYSAKLIGEKGKVAMLEGEPGGETARQRIEGFHKGIKKYPDTPSPWAQTRRARDVPASTCDG